jgi:hypothetical protein
MPEAGAWMVQAPAWLFPQPDPPDVSWLRAPARRNGVSRKEEIVRWQKLQLRPVQHQRDGHG